MAGIIYYKLNPSNYWQYMVGYDYTKNSSLVGNEIDNNFHYLEGEDVYSLGMNGPYLELTKINTEVERVKLTPYNATCGISINENNEIGLRFKENGGVSCFNGDLYIPRGCGIGIGIEEESCEGFNLFLENMLGQETATNYINTLIAINGEYYGGRTQPTNCDTPSCMDDQFYGDYLNYLRSGKLLLDVCGIGCDAEGNARIAVDDVTLKLDENCILSVNYGCGLEMHKEPTEQDYINFLHQNWDSLPNEGVDIECYITNVAYINGQLYTNKTGDFKEDQFYNLFTFEPTLNTDLYEFGGLICRDNGISVDYGCGLVINNEPDFEEFERFLTRFFNYTQSDLDELSEDPTSNKYWKEDQHYNSFLECLNSGALTVSLGENGAIACIGGSLYVSLGCGLDIEELTPCCSISDEDPNNNTDYSYQRFLSENWERITHQTQITWSDYWNHNSQFGCEYFGGAQCQTETCQNCDSYMNDQFFSQYVSFINGGRLIVKLKENGGILCDTNGLYIDTNKVQIVKETNP